MRKIVMMLGAAALLPLHADEYRFIVSGYPAANESYAAASAATSLETATRSGGSPPPRLKPDTARGTSRTASPCARTSTAE